MRATSQLRVDSVLERSLTIWLQNLVSFLVLTTVVYSPFILYSIMVLDSDMSEDGLKSYNGIKQIAGFILNLLVQAILIHGVFQQLRGQKADMNACFKAGLQRLLPVLLVGVAVAVMVGLGLLALIVPGMILMLVLYVAIPVTVVERLGVVDSLKRSHQLTNGHKGNLLFIVLILLVISMGIGLLFSFLVGALGSGAIDGLGGNAVVSAYFELLISIVVGSFAAVLSAVVYYQLRLIKDGVGMDELTRAMD